MAFEGNLVGTLGIGLVSIGTVRSVRGQSGPISTGLAVVGLVFLAVSTAGVLTSDRPRWILLSSVLTAAGLVGAVGLGVGTLRDDARLATAGYWLGCSWFAIPVLLVGRETPTVVAGTAVTLLLAVVYGKVVERTPARTVTVESSR